MLEASLPEACDLYSSRYVALVDNHRGNIDVPLDGSFHAKSRRTPTASEVNDAMTKARSALRLLEDGFGMLGLPSLAVPVYLVQGAIFAEPNEMLRGKEGFDSGYADYWTDIPYRPGRGSTGSPSQPDQTVEELASPAPVA